jgi:alpha-tubulin suppressor-like RCC1 family protein
VRRNAIFINLCVVLASAGPISSVTAQDGVVVAWGINFEGELEVRQPNSGYVAISAGAGHSLAMKADGSIYGWGDDSYGQASPIPNQGYIAVAAGDHNSLALPTTTPRSRSVDEAPGRVSCVSLAA